MGLLRAPFDSVPDVEQKFTKLYPLPSLSFTVVQLDHQVSGHRYSGSLNNFYVWESRVVFSLLSLKFKIVLKVH